jgi:thioredoxin-related protein
MAALPRPAAAADGWTLVMVEQTGCSYCARWHAEVAPEYPVTPEGRFAPLRTVDLRDLPDDITFATRPVFTPTFVLVRGGEEVGRIEGYPGEDFFWGLLGRLLNEGDATWATQETGG